jgi:small conductance mechanosensitive channel
MNNSVDNFNRYLQMAMDWGIVFVPKAIFAIILLFIGLRLVNKVGNTAKTAFSTKNIDPTIRPFFSSLIDLGLKFVLFLVIAGVFGFEITSILAILSALAFTVGLALQGSLGHFASGILLLIFKPYKVGDEIRVGDAEGFVTEIQVFNTVLRTRNARIITIPNGVITSGNIINLTGSGERRMDMIFIIDQPNDIVKVKEIIYNAVLKSPFVLQNHKTKVFLSDFNANELRFGAQPWCKSEEFSDAWASVQEEVKIALDSANLMTRVNLVQMINSEQMTVNNEQ